VDPGEDSQQVAVVLHGLESRDASDHTALACMATREAGVTVDVDSVTDESGRDSRPPPAANHQSVFAVFREQDIRQRRERALDGGKTRPVQSSRARVEEKSVHGVHDDRHAGQSGGNASGEPWNRAMGVHDVWLDAAKDVHEVDEIAAEGGGPCAPRGFRQLDWDAGGAEGFDMILPRGPGGRPDRVGHRRSSSRRPAADEAVELG